MSETNRRFPRYVALAALLIYGLTLSRGITLHSLPLAAKVAGWDWQPMAGQPLVWLLTLPLRGLPAGWIPVSLNLFSAVCGVLTLGLLARSIQLLPWDRPWNANNGWADKLPMLLACVVCGLEFSFWQEATAATGEMLDMLLLAAAIWCLLEYRVGRQSGWVNAAAVIWGLGLAENWVMLLTLPLFVVSLIWLRQARFFKADFLLRMMLLGLAGFSIYALPPLVNGLMPHSPWSFGEAWIATFKLTKHTLLMLYARFWVGHRSMMFAVLIFYLVPTLPCLVRLRDEGNQNKPKVDRFQIWIYRALRVALLLVCLWLTFDPTVSPRQIVMRQFKVSLPLLSFDYLNALGAGFLAGSLLLIFEMGSQQRRSRSSGLWWLAKRMAAPMLAGVLGLMTVGLIARNASAVMHANRQPLHSFGDLAMRSLPAEGGIVLSDDPQKLFVFQAALARRGESRRWLPVDTKSLPDPEYRAQLERKCPDGWLTGANRHELNPPEMMSLLDHAAQTKRLFYLHPASGFLLERFYMQPHGAVYEMKPYLKDQFNGPPMSALAADQNEKFWDEAWQTELEPASRACSPQFFGRSKTRETFLRRFHLSAIPSYQSQLLGEWCSAALDGWGVELQRNGRLPEARRRFEQAIALNTNNPVAKVNLQCNANLQAHNNMSVAEADTVASQLGDLRQLSVMISRYGSFDSPVFCYLLGNMCRQTGLFRQSVQQLERAGTLAPGSLAPEFALAQLYSRWRMDDKVFEIVSQLRKQTHASPAGDTADVDLALLEADSWLSQTNPAKASSVLQSVLKRHLGDNRTLNRVLQAYLAFGDYTNALQLVSGQLATEPNNVTALVSKAGVLIRMGNSSNAITLLNHVLAITNDPLARFNRAYAYLQTGNLPAAEADYLELDNSPADAFSVHFGLAEIAVRRHDTNLAVHHLELCLSNAPAGTDKWQETRKRLDALEPPCGNTEQAAHRPGWHHSLSFE